MADRRHGATHSRRTSHSLTARWWMWGTIAAVTVAALVGVVFVAGRDDADSTAGAGVVNADPALAVPFVGFDGAESTLEEFVGKPMVVNFFASWCVPCLAELPGFEAVHQQLGDSVTFVGLNLQDSPDAGVAVVSQTGISYNVARDPEGAVFTAFEGRAMPTTVFIGANGQVVEVWSGELSARELEDRIEELLL